MGAAFEYTSGAMEHDTSAYTAELRPDEFWPRRRGAEESPEAYQLDMWDELVHNATTLELAAFLKLHGHLNSVDLAKADASQPDQTSRAQLITRLQELEPYHDRHGKVVVPQGLTSYLEARYARARTIERSERDLLRATAKGRPYHEAFTLDEMWQHGVEQVIGATLLEAKVPTSRLAEFWRFVSDNNLNHLGYPPMDRTEYMKRMKDYRTAMQKERAKHELTLATWYALNRYESLEATAATERAAYQQLQSVERALQHEYDVEQVARYPHGAALYIDLMEQFCYDIGYVEFVMQFRGNVEEEKVLRIASTPTVRTQALAFAGDTGEITVRRPAVPKPAARKQPDDPQLRSKWMLSEPPQPNHKWEL